MPRRGFSLIELVVVIAILGITLGAVAPAFLRSRAPAGDPAASAIVTTLERARATALRSAREATVTLDPSTLRVWVRVPDASPTVDTTFVLAVDNATRLEAASPRPRFTFAADGRASGNQITVVSATARTAITVDPWTGDARTASVGIGAPR